MSDEKKPGVFMTDEQRAADALKRRERERVKTPAQGVVTTAFEPDDFTPVGQVLPLAHDEAARILVARIWQHTANMEMRMLAALGRTEGGQLRAELDQLAEQVGAHERQLVDTRGEKGDNGKLGELKRRVDGMSQLQKWVLTTILGGLIGLGTKLVIVTRAFDAVEARGIHNAALIERQDADIKILRAEVMTERAARASRRGSRAPEATADPATEPGRDSP